MDYLHASADALAGLFTLPGLIGLALGIVWGLLVSFMPGVGGNVAIALLLPFIFRLQVPEAIALLLGTHIATYFGGSITSITMNIPASAKSVSLCWDGYPLARRGKGAYALGASATASTLGGVVGAIVLTLGIPVMKSLLNVISNPEIFMLAIWGLVIIAMLSTGDLLKGLMSGGLGMLLSWVGESPITGVDRLTFGSQFLSYGITFAAAAMGLFAVAQAIRLLVESSGGSQLAADVTGARPAGRATKHSAEPANTTWRGARAVVRRWRLTLYMATFGVFTGAIPGLGAPVAAIAAYGQASQISKDVEFGSGAIEGVIAPQATEAASEGGGMLPMLALGIPTHEQQAILLSAFVVLGIAPGPAMLTTHLSVVFTVIWIIVLASLLVGAFGLVTGKYLARLSTLSPRILVPLILSVGMVGTFAINGRIGDSVTAVVFGLVGYVCVKYNYSRVNLIIGLVLGPILESNLHISVQLYGNAFVFHRPIALGIAVVVVLTIAWWMVKNRIRSGSGKSLRAADAEGLALPGAGTGWGGVVTAAAFTAAFAVALAVGLGYPPLTGRILAGVAAVCLALSLVNLGWVLKAQLTTTSAARIEPDGTVQPHGPGGGGRGEALLPGADDSAHQDSLVTPGENIGGARTSVEAPLAPVTALAGRIGVAEKAAQSASDADHADGRPAPGRSIFALASERRRRREERAGSRSRAEFGAVAVVLAFLAATMALGLVVGTGVAVTLFRIGVASHRSWKTVGAAVLVGAIAGALVTLLLTTLVSEYIPYDGLFANTPIYIGA